MHNRFVLIPMFLILIQGCGQISVSPRGIKSSVGAEVQSSDAASQNYERDPSQLQTKKNEPAQTADDRNLPAITNELPLTTFDEEIIRPFSGDLGLRGTFRNSGVFFDREYLSEEFYFVQFINYNVRFPNVVTVVYERDALPSYRLRSVINVPEALCPGGLVFIDDGGDENPFTFLTECRDRAEGKRYFTADLGTGTLLPIAGQPTFSDEKGFELLDFHTSRGFRSGFPYKTFGEIPVDDRRKFLGFGIAYDLTLPNFDRRRSELFLFANLADGRPILEKSYSFPRNIVPMTLDQLGNSIYWIKGYAWSNSSENEGSILVQFQGAEMNVLYSPVEKLVAWHYGEKNQELRIDEGTGNLILSTFARDSLPDIAHVQIVAHNGLPWIYWKYIDSAWITDNDGNKIQYLATQDSVCALKFSVETECRDFFSGKVDSSVPVTVYREGKELFIFDEKFIHKYDLAYPMAPKFVSSQERPNQPNSPYWYIKFLSRGVVYKNEQSFNCGMAFENFLNGALTMKVVDIRGSGSCTTAGELDTYDCDERLNRCERSNVPINPPILSVCKHGFKIDSAYYSTSGTGRCIELN